MRGGIAGSITDVAGILVGHAHDAVRGSGVTVLLFPGGAMAAADIRGEAAGTRQMDSLLRPHPVQKIPSLVFAGRSASGLDAASGVVRYLEARTLGTRALEKAIVDAVRCAKGNGSVPAAAELQGKQP